MFGPIATFLENLLAGWVSNSYGPTSMIGISIAIIATAVLVIYWHRQQRKAKKLGMASLSFILAAFAIGFLAIAAGAFGLGLRLAKVSSEQPIAQSNRNPRPYLKEAFIYPGATGINPQFSAKLTRNVGRGRIFVDDSWWPRALGPVSWTARRRIFLAEIKDFVAEQSFNIPIVTSVTGLPDQRNPSPQKLWRWGDGTTDPHFIYSTDVMHRGRIVFIGDDGPSEYFYFVVPAAPADQVPNFIGQQDLTFMREWEKEDASQK